MGNIQYKVSNSLNNQVTNYLNTKASTTSIPQVSNTLWVHEKRTTKKL